MTNLQKEIEGLIRKGKKSGNMQLRNAARNALFNCLCDDETPGLSEDDKDEICSQIALRFFIIEGTTEINKLIVKNPSASYDEVIERNER